MAAVFAPLDEVEELVAGDRRLRGDRQRQLDQSSRPRRRDRSRPGGRAGAAGTRAHRRPACRSATPFTPRSSPRPANRCAATLQRLDLRRPGCRSSPTSTGELLPHGRRRPSRCSTCSPARSPRRSSSSRDCARCIDARRARLRRSRSQAGPAGIRLGRARRRRRAQPGHQPSEAGRRASFNHALCGLYAAGPQCRPRAGHARVGAAQSRARPAQPSPRRHRSAAIRAAGRGTPRPRRARRQPMSPPDDEPVVITGAALGLPGRRATLRRRQRRPAARRRAVHRPDPGRMRHEMLDKHITRLVKSEEAGPVRDDRPPRRT